MPNFDSRGFKVITKEIAGPALFNFKMAGRLDFIPGQFIEVCLPHIGEAPFAPCSDPQKKDYFELCIRGCGSLTDEITKLLPSDVLNIRGPYGNGWPINALRGKDIIMVAGGMGLVPLRPLIFELLFNRGLYGKIYLFGGFRTKEHVLFKEDLDTWQKKLILNLYIEQPTKNPFYHRGLITEPLEKIKFNTKKSVVLICGPEAMVPFVLEALSSHNFRDDQIFLSFERRMECGIGVCQHCSIGKYLVCKDGPVFRYDKIKEELNK